MRVPIALGITAAIPAEVCLHHDLAVEQGLRLLT
jgi:hypothetical protein